MQRLDRSLEEIWRVLILIILVQRMGWFAAAGTHIVDSGPWACEQGICTDRRVAS
jgi:hypothetical protein